MLSELRVGRIQLSEASIRLVDAFDFRHAGFFERGDLRLDCFGFLDVLLKFRLSVRACLLQRGNCGLSFIDARKLDFLSLG